MPAEADTSPISTPDSAGLAPSRSGAGRFLFPAAIAVLWALMAAAAGPVAEFPLNDAWSYAEIPRVLIQEGRLFYPPWVSMALFSQVLWGTLFCLPFGFSYTALRLSTLALGLAGILATYGLLRECRARRPLAFFGALVVATNPIFFNLSLTFMSDVPFFSFAVLAAWCFARALRSGRSSAVLAGVIFACAATLVRDVGLVIPAAFFLAWLVRKNRPAVAIAALAAPLICHFGFQMWLEARQGLPALYTLPRELLLQTFRDVKAPLRIAKWSLIQLVCLGLFLFPFLAARVSRIGTGADHRSRNRKTAVWFVCSFLALALAVAFGCGRLMPLATKSGNILRDFGIGPALLSDVYSLGLPNLPAAPRWFWLAVTAAGIAGAALLIPAAVTAVRIAVGRKKEDRGPALFVVGAAAFAFIPFSLGEGFDRYYLLELPLMMAVALIASPGIKEESDPASQETFLPSGSSRVTRFVAGGLAVATLFLTGIFAVAGAREYLSWNRARWQALDELTGPAGVPPRDIDGGFEFNGLHTYDPNTLPTDPRFWMRDAPWMVTFGPVEGYREWKRYPYRRLLPWKKAHVLVLRREKETP